MELDRLQSEVNAWARENFGPHVPPYHRALMGANEEMGELCGVIAEQILPLVPILLAMQAMGNADRAQLKGEQGIRGTSAEHEVKGKDAVADVVIYLADYCAARGWDLNEIVTQTWTKTVQKRNWRANPKSGGAGNPEKALTLFKAAAVKFVQKVETGKAHSVETYAELKEALQALEGGP